MSEIREVSGLRVSNSSLLPFPHFRFRVSTTQQVKPSYALKISFSTVALHPLTPPLFPLDFSLETSKPIVSKSPLSNPLFEVRSLSFLPTFSLLSTYTLISQQSSSPSSIKHFPYKLLDPSHLSTRFLPSSSLLSPSLHSPPHQSTDSHPSCSKLYFPKLSLRIPLRLLRYDSSQNPSLSICLVLTLLCFLRIIISLPALHPLSYICLVSVLPICL